VVKGKGCAVLCVHASLIASTHADNADAPGRAPARTKHLPPSRCDVFLGAPAGGAGAAAPGGRGGRGEVAFCAWGVYVCVCNPICIRMYVCEINCLCSLASTLTHKCMHAPVAGICRCAAAWEAVGAGWQDLQLPQARSTGSGQPGGGQPGSAGRPGGGKGELAGTLVMVFGADEQCTARRQA